MKALVVSNCVTQTYMECLQSMFPAWEIRGVAIDLADAWLTNGSKPDFEDYARTCDLYVGWPMGGHAISAIINSAADRVIIPGIYFRGLHPDVAVLPNFRGPFSVKAPNTQASLITLAGAYLGYSVDETVSLFNEDSYRCLGFFDCYNQEKDRLLNLFRAEGIDLTTEFENWEMAGDFFHICHHPRVFVLVDIIRRALLDRYLDAPTFSSTASLRETQVDHLARAEAWPIYPGLVTHLGAPASMIWRLPSQLTGRELTLPEMVDTSFRALSEMEASWRETAFVADAARALLSVNR